MLDARLRPVERGGSLPPHGVAWDWLSVGLGLPQEPVGHFGQKSSQRADGDGVALRAGGTLIGPAGELVAPAGMVSLTDEDLGAFDFPPRRCSPSSAPGACGGVLRDPPWHAVGNPLLPQEDWGLATDMTAPDPRKPTD